MTTATEPIAIGTANALTDAARHIVQLFSPGSLASNESIELRTFLHGIPAKREFYASTALVVRDALRCSDAGHDVFVGVAPRRCPAAPTMRQCRHEKKGDKRHVVRVRRCMLIPADNQAIALPLCQRASDRLIISTRASISRAASLNLRQHGDGMREIHVNASTALAYSAL